MYPSLPLILALALLAGGACAQDGTPAPRAGGMTEGAEAASQSGSSEPSAPATQESQGIRLDEGSGNAPASRATVRAEECTNAGASPGGPDAGADCAAGETRTPR
jgi:hypothetical protein